MTTGSMRGALAEFEQASRLQKPDYNMLVNWGLTYQRMGQLDLALAKLQQAAALEQTAHVYSQIGMIYVQRVQSGPALEALATAEKLDPNWAPTYNYRAKLYYQLNDLRPAAGELPARPGARSHTRRRARGTHARRDDAPGDRPLMRIGVNALYLIPGGVGGTEIYLRRC